MTSRRRRKSKWRWGLLLIIVAAIVFWVWPDADSSPVVPEPQTRNTASAQPEKSGLNRRTSTPIGSSASRSPMALIGDTPARKDTAATPVQSDTPLASSTGSARIADTLEKTIATPQVVFDTPPESAATHNHSIKQALQLAQAGKLLEARTALNDLLLGAPTSHEAQTLRDKLAEVNQILIFSPRVIPGDPLTGYHTVGPGDYLSTIAPPYRITYQFIEHINGVSARRIRRGQRIKIVQGPFRAVVHKSDYRMDIFLDGPDDQPVYIRSFIVGLGEDDSTPLGHWIARRGGKVANPGWTNPRTGKVYAPDDPQNPIGEYWIGLQGNDENTKGLAGYGIHGTIESDSIGRQVSMGCVRLERGDIDLVYKILVDGYSTVTVLP